jgi:hypothetical protein
MLIKREEIIEAITNEPLLRPGAWVAVPFDEKTGRWDLSAPKTTPCAVCAVGAVMRAVLPANTTLGKLISTSADATRGEDSESDFDFETEIEAGRWLSALSRFFERLWLGYDYELDETNETKISEEVRGKTIAFVKRRFPETIEVELDHAD